MYENKVAALVNYNNPAGKLKFEIGFVVLSRYIVFSPHRPPRTDDIIYETRGITTAIRRTPVWA